ncbi:MAG: peptidoglycan-binding domain-containing protein [Halomonas sp.]|nr:peptidoglycan-binding domain-containing protein [Halomonas sp.]
MRPAWPLVLLASLLATMGSAVQAQPAAPAVDDQRWTQEVAHSPGTPLYASPARIRQVQQALNQAGFNAGHVDGLWGPQSSRAARHFLKSCELAPTQALTLQLINALGLAHPLTAAVDSEAASDMQWRQEQTPGPGIPIHIGPANVRQLQRALNLQGYEAGAVDGHWGTASARGARAFQRAQGIEPTGRVDLALIERLGLGDVILAGVGHHACQVGEMQWTQEHTQGDGARLYAGPALVRRLQQALNRQGFDAGRVDGLWGSETARSARRYQATQGLEPTGTLTLETLGALKLASPRPVPVPGIATP